KRGRGPMGDADGFPVQEQSAAPAPRTGGELRTRVLSAVVAGLAAIAAAWFGGVPFILFWAVAAAAVWWEWLGIVQAAQRSLLAGVGGVTFGAMTAALTGGTPACAIASAFIGAAVAGSAARS